MTRSALLALLAALTIGCGPQIHLRGSSTAGHPLRTPDPRAGEVTVTNEGCANLGIDLRACTATARLLRASAEQVCVEVTLGENADSPWADTARMALVSDTGQSAAAQVAGRSDRPDSFDGFEWRTIEHADGTYENAQVPVRYRWNFATRQVCFVSDGPLLTPATTWIELRVLPEAEYSYNWGFRWDLQ